jgi:PadR family transcriptional regulator AphA
MSTQRLTEGAYIVLALLEHVQPATPYDLKLFAERATIDFWTVSHAQTYNECARLAREGLLAEEREQTGRRRRIYTLTELGRSALAEWLQTPVDSLEAVRDLSILKLFFGADPATLAPTQLEMHEERLRRYESHAEARDAARAAGGSVPPGASFALEAGIGHEREYVRLWKKMRDSRAD